VLGTFNLDPALLSALVAQTSTASQRRLLWEWRPSWMPVERKASDLARRPYYVVARIPASLLKALETRQGFSSESALELLQVLGHRGIGLASLNAEAGTQESAAAGFFYAIQLLLPPESVAAQAPGPNLGERILCVIPLDAVDSILQGMADKKLERRADLIAVAVSLLPDGIVKLCFVPVEVKHHGMPSHPEPIPSGDNRELKRAREQLLDTAQLLSTICEALRAPADKTNIAGLYLKRLAMATLVDLAMSFAPAKADAGFRSQILRGIMLGRISLGVGDAVLSWFAPGSAASSGGPCVVDRYGAIVINQVRIRELFIDPSVLPGLWWNGATVGATESQVRTFVNNTIEAAFATCAGETTQGTDELASSFRDLLDLAEPLPANLPVTPNEPPQPGPSSTQQPITTHVPPPAGLGSGSASQPPAQPSTPADPEPLVAAEPTLPPLAQRLVQPRAVVGWSSLASRWTLVGKLTGNDEPVVLDLDHPKTLGVYGYMGSGKSYLLGNLIESAVQPIAGINGLPVPLAVIVFNYRRNASDRFELSSLAVPNQNQVDIQRLHQEYGAAPTAVQDMHVLCLPGELRPSRQQEYGVIPATELYFDPRTLGAEDWELLMGEPGSEAVFARTIRNTLVDLRSAGDITLESLEQQVEARLSGQSRAAARLRFDFVRRYLSTTQGTDFAQLLRSGRVLVVDLRQPLFNKDDALRFFLVCANQISKVQGRFNKMIVFDEAHEYMSDAFGERMESRIRLMRHEGTSYVFATQDVQSIPLSISRFLTTRFVFDLGTRENTQDLEQAAPEFRGFQLLGMRPGHCFVHASASTDGMFARPREIRVRPRATQHGGASQIFTNRQGA
jgi:hypothetical protein